MRLAIQSITKKLNEAEEFSAFCLEEPRLGFGSDSFGLRFLGWYIAKSKTVERVSIAFSGETLDSVSPVRRLDVAAAFPDADPNLVGGFEAVVPIVEIAGSVELSVTLHFAGGSQSPVSIAVAITPLDVGFSPKRVPILLTTGGRMGSTMTMTLISSHPEIITQGSLPYEDKSALYWLRVAATLSMPADLIRSTKGMEFEQERFFVGYNPYINQLNLPHPDARASRWPHETLPASTYRYYMGVIDSYYGAVAEDCGKPDSRYFVEKANHGILPPMLRELYPESKEVFLVRDPRDMYLSIRAFNQRRGFEDFHAEKFDLPSDYIRFLGDSLKGMITGWERRAANSFLVKYEDFISDPHAVARSLFQYIGVSHSDAAVVSAVARTFREDNAVRAHVTSSSIASSVNRWQTELSPELRDCCQTAFRSFLECFDYR